MTEIEKMKKYIERTKMNVSLASPYQMSVRETLDLAKGAAETPVDIICLAFDYGCAKGYRAAKAEGRATA